MRSRPGHADGGVTAETAVLLPALGVLLSIGIGVIHVVLVQVACVDAARAGARAASRGEPLERVAAETRRSAPRGAVVAIRRDTALTRVDVRVHVRHPGPLPDITVHADATTTTEPGLAPGTGPPQRRPPTPLGGHPGSADGGGHRPAAGISPWGSPALGPGRMEGRPDEP